MYQLHGLSSILQPGNREKTESQASGPESRWKGAALVVGAILFTIFCLVMLLI